VEGNFGKHTSLIDKRRGAFRSPPSLGENTKIGSDRKKTIESALIKGARSREDPKNLKTDVLPFCF